MIDTDKYEGCQTDHSLTLHKGLLCTTIFMDVDGSGKIVPTLDRGIVDVQADIPEHYLFLLRDAPLLLQEVKRLREELDGREAYIKRLSEQLVRATKWAYQQVCHNDSAMMDFDDYVWGEEE